MSALAARLEMLEAKVDYLARLVETLARTVSEEEDVQQEPPVVHNGDTGLD